MFSLIWTTALVGFLSAQEQLQIKTDAITVGFLEEHFYGDSFSRSLSSDSAYRFVARLAFYWDDGKWNSVGNPCEPLAPCYELWETRHWYIQQNNGNLAKFNKLETFGPLYAPPSQFEAVQLIKSEPDILNRERQMDYAGWLGYPVSRPTLICSRPIPIEQPNTEATEEAVSLPTEVLEASLQCISGRSNDVNSISEGNVEHNLESVLSLRGPQSLIIYQLMLKSSSTEVSARQPIDNPLMVLWAAPVL